MSQRQQCPTPMLSALGLLLHEFQGRSLLMWLQAMKPASEDTSIGFMIPVGLESVFIVEQHNASSRAAQQALEALTLEPSEWVPIRDTDKEMKFIQVSASVLYRTLGTLNLGDSPNEPTLSNGEQRYSFHTLVWLLSMAGLYVSGDLHFGHLEGFRDPDFVAAGLKPSDTVMLLTSTEGAYMKIRPVANEQWMEFVREQNRVYGRQPQKPFENASSSSGPNGSLPAPSSHLDSALRAPNAGEGPSASSSAPAIQMPISRPQYHELHVSKIPPGVKDQELSQRIGGSGNFTSGNLGNTNPMTGTRDMWFGFERKFEATNLIQRSLGKGYQAGLVLRGSRLRVTWKV